MRLNFTFLIPALLPLLGACAGNPGSGSAEPCVLEPGDSVFLASGPAFRACQVERPARVRTRGTPLDFRPSQPPAGRVQCYEAEVEFVVDAAGIPETGTARVVRSNHPDFGLAVLSALPNWRYEPARLDGVPVRQIVQERQTAAYAVVVTRAGEVRRPPPTPRC